MAKTKKDGFFVLLFKALWEIIVYSIIYLFKGIKYLVIFLFRVSKKTKYKIADIKKDNKRPRNDAVHVDFEEVKNISGNLEEFNKKMLRGKSTIGLIIGARGTGKSAIGLRIIENLVAETGKTAYAIGFKKETLPKWINIANDINEVKGNSFVLVDEGGITFSSRNAMSDMNKMLSNILLVARHNDLSILFISQNSSNIEVNTIRQADYLILKPSSLLQKDFERKKIKDIYEEVEKDFKELKDTIGVTYIYSDQYRGFVANSLPSFWSEDVSKAWKK